MRYLSYYDTPIGMILLAADDIGLTGLWFEGQKHYASKLEPTAKETKAPVFDAAKQWLNLYFSGQAPNVTVPLHLIGTAFQTEVWRLLCQIPYGQTVTYGELARQMTVRANRTSMSAQAVGNAVGRNRISILIPCHRVVGADGSLTGYAGGLHRKEYLLTLENGGPVAVPQSSRPVLF